MAAQQIQTLSSLHTPRLQLRPLEGNDQALYVGLYTDAVVMRHIGPPMTPDAAARAFQNALKARHGASAGPRLWVLSETARAKSMGLLGLGFTEAGSGELGIIIDRQRQGQGLASEALAALLGHAFDHLALGRLQSRHHAQNQAMAAVLSKLGFVALAPGRDPVCLWQLTRTRWIRQHNAPPQA